jgi:hypothetical protein
MKHSSIDLLLALLSLAGSCGIALYTAIRCQGEKEFLLLAMWKLLLSITLGAAAISRSRDLWTGNMDWGNASAFIIFSWLGMLIGLGGIGILVKRSWADNHKVHVVTEVVGAAAAFLLIVHLWVYLEWGGVGLKLIDDEFAKQVVCALFR